MRRQKLRSQKRRRLFFRLLLIVFILVGVFFGFKFISEFWQNQKQKIIGEAEKETVLEKKLVGGKIISKTFKENFTISEIEKSNSVVLPPNQNVAPKLSVDHYWVTFESFDEQNKSIIITAQYFVPKPEAKKPFPLFVFGSGTTGISDLCAPSKEQPAANNWGNYRDHMLSYASQGYIVIFPDYAGFNDPERVHRYFHRELGGRVLLDSARSFYNFYKQEELSATPQEKIFLAGYSHGGFAAISAKEIAPRYAPELDIAGTVSFAPALNVEALLKDAPALAPYLITAYQDVYGANIINTSKVFQERWLTNLSSSINLCINEVYRHYGYDARRIYTPDFYKTLTSGTLSVEHPKLKEVIEKNRVGTKTSNTPSLLLQGATDPIVTAKTVKETTRKMCDLGNKITYTEYTGINHFVIKGAGFRNALSWMEDILEGRAPRPNCESI